jgi:hypothetical protein
VYKTTGTTADPTTNYSSLTVNASDGLVMNGTTEVGSIKTNIDIAITATQVD